MVDPSITDEDRLSFARKVKLGFALLVGLSMALVTVRFGADLPLVAGALLAGTIAGGALALWIVPDGMTGANRRR